MRSSLVAAPAYAVLYLVGTATAIAQDATAVARLPRDGTTTYVTYYTSHVLAKQALSANDKGAVLEVLGVTRNTDGKPYFDNMSVRCIGYAQTVGGKFGGQGNCVETDPDGDKVFTTFDYVSATHNITGGTGKYEGISGSVPFTRRILQPPGPDEIAALVDHKVTWHLAK
ncbi:hypothetical protein AB6809_11190 [Paraburkholderia sp. RCC_158]|uniref:hypothetical protein n=1 Tax=Paraburkholderia sp. RCC_158 TaxID=3239220 RepID=UPI003526C324